MSVQLPEGVCVQVGGLGPLLQQSCNHGDVGAGCQHDYCGLPDGWINGVLCGPSHRMGYGGVLHEEG